MTTPYYVECVDPDAVVDLADRKLFGPFESRALAMAELHYLQANRTMRCNNLHRVTTDVADDARVLEPRTSRRERVWQQARDAAGRAGR